jgi:hypothetical protein
MASPTTITALDNQRGVALPMAMITLLIVTALMFAFMTLATSEPLIGRNHALGAQARALGESGIERALWAMNNAPPMFESGVASSPYDGSQLLTVSDTAGFRVRITDGSNANEKLVTAVGWVPDNSDHLRSARKIQVTLSKLPWTATVPGAPLNVVGNVDVAGNAVISSYAGTSGVVHCAIPPTGGTMTTGVVTETGNSHDILGPDDNIRNEPEDKRELVSPSSITTTLTTEDLNLLKAQAKAAGTYYQGSVTFNDGHLLPPSGSIIFVDTTTGNDLTMGPPQTPISEMGNVSINSNQTWNGWIIAMGDLNVSGTVHLTGGLYARNDFVFTGNGVITGAVTAENKLLTVQSSVDSSTTGSSHIIYDCPAFQSGGGKITPSWFVKPGTYREVAGTSSY